MHHLHDGAALLVAVPASAGFIGNALLAQSAPVRMPSQAVVVDDNGLLRKHVQAGDDKDRLRTERVVCPRLKITKITK